MKKTAIKNSLTAMAVLVSLLSAALCVQAAGSSESAAALNSAPVAENMELTTYRGVPVTGTFRCLDPEGDEVVYSLATKPKKGEALVEGDTFTYTPAPGKKGRDTFTYVATDTAGNVSNAATVTVEIKKQRSTVTYSDLEGNPAWYAATVLAERGIFVGESVGGQNLFRPDEPVTRGEFLVMCMKASGAPLLPGIIRTGFSDDEDIPGWQKSYVTTAVMDDIITGAAQSDGRILFSPGDIVTFAQASVMLNNAVGITDVSLDGEEVSPAWAAQAAANLSSCDIIRDTSQGVSAAPVTRADAALMLLGALEIMDSRSIG